MLNQCSQNQKTSTNQDVDRNKPRHVMTCVAFQTSYQPGNLRPNRHLANIVERLREVVLGSGKQLKVILCVHHGEKLQLFCKEDGKLICWLCERSQEHRGHHTFLMEEAAQEYQVGAQEYQVGAQEGQVGAQEGQEKFLESLKKLRQEQQETEQLKAVILGKRASWKNQVEPERHRVQAEFNKLRLILDKEEQQQLKNLEEEERKGLSILEEAENELVQQSQSLRELISDLEWRCQGSAVELLQDVSDVTKRSELWTWKKPEALPTKLKSVFRAPDLKKMLRVFRELHAQSHGTICRFLNIPTLLSFHQGHTCLPEAQLRYPLDTLWTDQHLNNMAERLREVKFGPKEKQKRDLCVHHAEKLLLFCAEDRKVICWLCERSQEHRGHHTFVMEEAVQECQKKLQASLERLRKEQQEAEKLEADIREERISWKYQIQTERQRIQTEFNQLRSILDSEEQRELQRLEEEEKKTLDNLAEAEAELVRQNELVKELISDLEHRSEWSTMKLLQKLISCISELEGIKSMVLERHKVRDVGSASFVMPRGEIWTLKKPKTVSTKLKSVFRAPDLSGMLHMFRGEEHQVRSVDVGFMWCQGQIGELVQFQREDRREQGVQRRRDIAEEDVITLDITLNPVNLNLNLVLSEDQRQVMSIPIWPVKVYFAGKLHPNRSVANIVEKLRDVKLSTEEEQKKDLCVRHGEKLLLFCKEDGKVICWLCERSQEHRGHHTFLMEEVAQEYQEKLQSVLERLREEEQEAKKLEANFREEKASWKIQIQSEKQSVQAEFKQLRDILDSEEKKELQKLVDEEDDILYNLAESENRVTQHSGSLRELISALEGRLKGSTMELLQDVNCVIESDKDQLKLNDVYLSRGMARLRNDKNVPLVDGMSSSDSRLHEATYSTRGTSGELFLGSSADTESLCVDNRISSSEENYKEDPEDGCEKACSLTLAIPLSEEKLRAALKKLRKEQQEAEELEVDIRGQSVSWKIGRKFS
ncbi:hypothetical protein MC885_017162 [Smutsia gigantea]|nr:hypothetical protein MC885_017162 [Smutsia gigantea]